MLATRSTGARVITPLHADSHNILAKYYSVMVIILHTCQILLRHARLLELHDWHGVDYLRHGGCTTTMVSSL